MKFSAQALFTIGLLSAGIAFAGHPDSACDCQCGSHYLYPQPNLHRGFYIEGNAGTNVMYEDLHVLGYRLNSDQIGGVGLNANLGYLFIPYLGAELGFTAYIPNVNYLPTVNSINGALKAILPLGDHFSVFLKAGLMFYFLEEAKVGVGVGAYYMGAGVSYAINQSFAITAQMQGGLVPKWGNDVSLSLLSVGLTYYFN